MTGSGTTTGMGSSITELRTPLPVGLWHYAGKGTNVRPRLRKWYFGYDGAMEYYWLMARTESGLLRQIASRGFAKPDWVD